MSSIAAVAAELRRSAALLQLELLHTAIAHFEEARTILAEAGQGSQSPEVPAALRTLTEAIDHLHRARHLTTKALATADHYLAHLGAAPRSDGNPTASPPGHHTTPLQPATRDAPRQGRRQIDPALIAEAQRQGAKISPERVVRIGRDRTQRIVWLEQGDKKSGLQHMTESDRMDDFAPQWNRRIRDR